MTRLVEIRPTLVPMSRKVKSGTDRGVLVAPDAIEQRILSIRGYRAMLDRDLAELYGVPTGTLNQAVSRNLARFPADFAFRVTAGESVRLISQSVISNGRGGNRHAPRVFTEQGVAMLSSVLRSRRAVDVNIGIMRVFVRVRELFATHRNLARKIDEMERKYDGKFAVVFDAIRALTAPTPDRAAPRPRIGFIREPEPTARDRAAQPPRKTRAGSAASARREGTKHAIAAVTTMAIATPA
jgi:hypothetical protein